jgi:nicotinamide riboside transporter PnuC
LTFGKILTLMASTALYFPWENAVSDVLVVKKTWLEWISQIAIFTGSLSVLALGNGNRWGFVLGLAIQPFWYYTAIRHRQWGLVAASIVYTAGWILGVWKNFDIPSLFNFL